MPDDRKSTTDAFLRARERMSPAQREQLDGTLMKSLESVLRRGEELQAVVSSLFLFHREGTGDRSGFCRECGKVHPCYTRQNLEPYTKFDGI